MSHLCKTVERYNWQLARIICPKFVSAPKALLGVQREPEYKWISLILADSMESEIYSVIFCWLRLRNSKRVVFSLRKYHLEANK